MTLQIGCQHRTRTLYAGRVLAEGTWSIQSGAKGTLFGMRWNVCSIRLTIIRGRLSARQIFDERRFFGCMACRITSL
jgi:hypothetical protein